MNFRNVWHWLTSVCVAEPLLLCISLNTQNRMWKRLREAGGGWGRLGEAQPCTGIWYVIAMRLAPLRWKVIRCFYVPMILSKWGHKARIPTTQNSYAIHVLSNGSIFSSALFFNILILYEREKFPSFISPPTPSACQNFHLCVQMSLSWSWSIPVTKKWCFSRATIYLRNYACNQMWMRMMWN